MTHNRKKANFRGHYVSHEKKFWGHLKKSRAKSPFFEEHSQGKHWVTYNNMFLSHKTYLLYAHHLIRICSVLERTGRKIKINIEIYDRLFLWVIIC